MDKDICWVVGSLYEDEKAYGREVGGQRCRWVPEIVLGSNLETKKEIPRNSKMLRSGAIFSLCLGQMAIEAMTPSLTRSISVC